MNNHMSRSKYQPRRRTTESDPVYNQNASHTADCEPIHATNDSQNMLLCTTNGYWYKSSTCAAPKLPNKSLLLRVVVFPVVVVFWS